MNLFEARDLCKIYRLGQNHEVRALQDVSFTMEKGRWLAISGPSGSGKSTLLAILAALDRPSSGEVLFNGENLSSANDVRLARYRKEKIGVVFQEYQLFEELSALENVCMPLVVSHLNRKSQKERGMTLLEHVGLADRALHLPRQLSGGERQRVAIARALIHDPEVIFADEPTSNIDKKAADMVMTLFHSFKEQGKSLVVVSHSLALAEVSDEQLHMEAGRLVE
jgi:putative ABC transport system ATP-binding protein